MVDSIVDRRRQIEALALSNYGHFSTFLVDKCRVRGLSLHLERLVHDSRVLFSAELNTDHVREVVREAVGDHRYPVVARVTITDPEVSLTQLDGASLRPVPFVTVRPAPSPTSHQTPFRVRTITFQRECPEVKHVGLFSTLFYRRESQLEGFDDVLFIDPNGYVSEGSTWNIGFIESGRVVVPQASYLPGVTMRLIEERCGFEVERRQIHILELLTMKAVFAANAVSGIRWIHQIDDGAWRDEGSILRELKRMYNEIPMENL